jgi:hypothetical protein
MRKSIKELRVLNTRNLLRFFKSERKKFYGSGYWCGCGCGEMIWEARPSQSDMEQKYNEHKNFLELIKTELNTREHVRRYGTKI